MLSRKDYIWLAAKVAAVPSIVDREIIISFLTAILSENNPRFNETKFREACNEH